MIKYDTQDLAEIERFLKSFPSECGKITITVHRNRIVTLASEYSLKHKKELINEQKGI